MTIEVVLLLRLWLSALHYNQAHAEEDARGHVERCDVPFSNLGSGE